MSTIKVDTIATRTGSGNITLSNSLASATVAGDLTVDTNVLKVDSTNNRVGIGTASPSFAISAVGGSRYQFSPNTLSGGGIAIQEVDSSTIGLYGINHDNNAYKDVAFFAGASETCRITSAGFAIGGTGSDNTFDDYEKGSWTVGVTKNAAITSPNSSHAYYIRVGDLAFLSFYWYKTGVTTSGSDYWKITGIPFNMRAGAASGYQHGHVGYLNIAGDKTGNGNHRWQVNNATEFLLYGGNSTTNVSNQAVELSGSVTCRIA